MRSNLPRIIDEQTGGQFIPIDDSRLLSEVHQRGLTIPGEIDVLLADTNQHRLWVIEAKYPNAPYDAARINHEINDFHGPAMSLRVRIG